MSDNKPIKLAILWHMHQPDYRDPKSGISLSPWVRLRATKDYLDMLLLATEHENVKVTFNLVPSLLEQFEHDLNGGSDRQLELTSLDPSQLSETGRKEILANCFKCNFENMIKPYSRYLSLHQKWEQSNFGQKSFDFNDDEVRDAQVWSNLT
ncbi:MAG: glycoside hydrolase family 57 protein, partial [Candidatus Zixiibacteriota bacterium]